MIAATITAYCLCAVCCGRTGGLTASGTFPRVGVTVAAPRNVRFGTWVRISIPGRAPIVRRVEDRTAKRWDGRWDILLPDHEAAKVWGIKQGKVEKVEVVK